jgi:hypothetical protein
LNRQLGWTLVKQQTDDEDDDNSDERKNQWVRKPFFTPACENQTNPHKTLFLSGC